MEKLIIPEKEIMTKIRRGFNKPICKSTKWKWYFYKGRIRLFWCKFFNKEKYNMITGCNLKG